MQNEHTSQVQSKSFSELKESALHAIDVGDFQHFLGKLYNDAHL